MVGGWGCKRTQAETVVAVKRRRIAGICMVTVAEEEEEATMKSILSSVQVVDDESGERWRLCSGSKSSYQH
jgi:hypothetical protein